MNNNFTPKTNREKGQSRKVWSILSIIFAIIPIILWIYCYIASGGSNKITGPGYVWWLIFVYYGSIGLPLGAISIAFGIVGLKTKLRWLSIISLILKTVTIISVIVLLYLRSRP